MYFKVEGLWNIDWSELSTAMRSCGAITNMDVRETTPAMHRDDMPTPQDFIQAIFRNQMRLLEHLIIGTRISCHSNSIHI